MILGIIFLAITPLFYWLISPNDWTYSRALEYQRQGEWDKAEEIYLKVLSSQPNHTMALFRLGEIKYRQGDFDSSLRYADQSYFVARADRRPSIINLRTNSLLALDQSKAAVDSVEEMRAFSTVPENFQELTGEQLLPLMQTTANRQFFNGLAYTMAIGRYEVQQAERYISSLLSYVEMEPGDAKLTAAYLFERSSKYEEAFAALQVLVKDLEKQRKADDGGDNESLNRLLFLTHNRLKLLAEKVDVDAVQIHQDALDSFRNEDINEENCRLEIDDSRFLQWAYELQHYYDTRAMVYLALANKLVAESIRKRNQDVGRFINANAAAESYYQKGYDDLLKSIQLSSSMEAFQQKFPENSMMISLPADNLEYQREKKRLDAVTQYHRYLFLLAFEKHEEAEACLEAILEAGFEPGPSLF